MLQMTPPAPGGMVCSMSSWSAPFVSMSSLTFWSGAKPNHSFRTSAIDDVTEQAGLDEDIGCLGIAGLLDDLFDAPEVVVGEPLQTLADRLRREELVFIVVDLDADLEVACPD